MNGAVVIDASDLLRVFDKLGERARNLDKVMPAIGVMLAAAVDDVFQSEGGGSWEPLSDATIARSPRRAGGKILQDTGLTANIQTEQGQDGDGYFVAAYSPSAYGHFHLDDTANMPARDFLDIDTDALLSEMENVLMEEMLR